MLKPKCKAGFHTKSGLVVIRELAKSSKKAINFYELVYFINFIVLLLGSKFPKDIGTDQGQKFTLFKFWKLRSNALEVLFDFGTR